LLFLFYGSVVDDDIDIDHTQSVKQVIERSAKQLPVLLENLDSEGVNLVLLFMHPMFENHQYQLTMYLHVFPSLSIALGPQVSRTVFLKGLQRIFDDVTSSLDTVTLLKESYLSNILQAFGQDCFLEYLMSSLLDILSQDYKSGSAAGATLGGSSLPQSPRTNLSTSTAPTSLAETSLPSGSLVSYEVSPPYEAAKDSISLTSNFDLDVMFSERPFQMLRTDSQQDLSETGSLNSDDINITTISNSPDRAYDLVDGSPRPTTHSEYISTKDPSSAMDMQKSLPGFATHIVLSSQEILSNSGIEDLIEVSATSQSLPSFSYEMKPDAHLLVQPAGRPTPLIEDMNLQRTRTESEPPKSPFTVLLENSHLLQEKGTGIEDNDGEVLEEVPMNAGAANMRSETIVTEDGSLLAFLHIYFDYTG